LPNALLECLLAIGPASLHAATELLFTLCDRERSRGCDSERDANNCTCSSESPHVTSVSFKGDCGRDSVDILRNRSLRYHPRMDSIDRLAELFQKFPGIGPRQAQRFVQYLLRSSPALRRELVESVRDLASSVHQCPECLRFSSGAKGLCSICSNKQRDTGLLAIVASDADLSALERSHTYSGRYFVIGGLISLASEKINTLRIKELLASVPKRSGLKEVILAFPANPEGDATAVRVREELEKAASEHGFKVTKLGRGLSTGSELEYADPDTIKSALEGRR
jgi:recombination protein RecR